MRTLALPNVLGALLTCIKLAVSLRGSCSGFLLLLLRFVRLETQYVDMGLHYLFFLDLQHLGLEKLLRHALFVFLRTQAKTPKLLAERRSLLFKKASKVSFNVSDIGLAAQRSACGNLCLERKTYET